MYYLNIIFGKHWWEKTIVNMTVMAYHPSHLQNAFNINVLFVGHSSMFSLCGRDNIKVYNIRVQI